MRRRTRETVSVEQEVEVDELVCDASGEMVATLAAGGGSVQRWGFELHPVLVGERSDGTPFTMRMPTREPLVLSAREAVRIFGASRLGELFPAFTFHGDGTVTRRRASNGQTKGPEVPAMGEPTTDEAE